MRRRFRKGILMSDPDERLKMKTLKIAMICMHSSPIGRLGTRDTGGMSVYVNELAQRLARKGHTVDIFTRAQDLKSRKVLTPLHNLRIIHLNGGPCEPLSQRMLYPHLPEFFQNLERFRKEGGIRYDLVHSHYYLSGQAGRWAQERWRVPHLLMFHTLGSLKNRILTSGKEPDFRLAVEKSLAVHCHRVVAATEREKLEISRMFDVSFQKIGVVPCGVDLEKFRPLDPMACRTRLNLDRSLPLLVYVGRFDPVKGVDRLLRAAAKLRQQMDFRLVLVGGGGEGTPEVQKIRMLCEHLSLNDMVRFSGGRTHDDLPLFYSAADALVLSSHYESFGLVLLEALACGTPVVATPVGAAKDIVRNGVNGLLVSDNNPDNLAEAMGRILKASAGQVFSRESVRATVSFYDWHFVTAAIEQEYEELTKGPCCCFSSREKEEENLLILDRGGRG